MEKEPKCKEGAKVYTNSDFFPKETLRHLIFVFNIEVSMKTRVRQETPYTKHTAAQTAP